MAKNCRYKIWKTIRMMKVFTNKDIARITTENYDTVQAYTRNLARSGYIRPENVQADGKTIVYRCLKPQRISHPRDTDLISKYEEVNVFGDALTE